MTHDFISYSRHNVTFADSLFHHLKKHDRNPWLDFRRLVPGQPWEKQIFQAVENAGVILLVITPQSLSSKNVRDEWTMALALDKRIVLLIYEATPIPVDLNKCEWVDFRGSFDKAFQKLLGILNVPYAPCDIRPPQSGFKMPPVPRLLSISVALVVINGILGLEYPLSVIRNVLLGTETGVMTPLDWVGFGLLYTIPIIILVRLIPLPLQIARRTYRFHDIETALFMATLLHPLMVTGFIPAFFIPLQLIGGYLAGYHVQDLMSVLLAVFIIFLRAGLVAGIAAVCWIVFRFSDAMYRWTGVEGVYSVHRVEDTKKQAELPRQTIHVQVIYAAEDSVIGDELVHEFREYGHQVDVSYPNTDADADSSPSVASLVLILVSRYHALPYSERESQIVIPVILESVDIPDALARRQWIDLRRGLPNKMSATLASLLAHPDVLVEQVGVIPTRLTTLRPVIVNSLITALHLMIGFNILWLIGASLTGLV
ncbi:MAG TPA: toll/interleukin-1 receptor domain-containing protein, partial [Phototrophicaceae bacterium]|nr:toll/interleukin-1 receptor domain-containing protein [Phototrophicaceae bacterium]